MIVIQQFSPKLFSPPLREQKKDRK
jgi:hypothetical protein